MDMASMDMNQDNSTMAMTMLTAFTTEIGQSNLWFANWTPTSSGATAGASIGLFFIAILSRFLHAFSRSANVAWNQSIAVRRCIALQEHSNLSSTTTADPSIPSRAHPTTLQHIPPHLALYPPFIPTIDVPRGLLFGFEAFLGYLLMLAVMSYSAWFFISIILGGIVGEVAFGRLGVQLGGLVSSQGGGSTRTGEQTKLE